jgi:hypothetical protein
MPNKTTEVETNSTPNSIKEVQLKALTFRSCGITIHRAIPTIIQLIATNALFG